MNGTIDELVSAANGDDIVTNGLRSPNSKALHENRIKHKAIRPSARLNSLGSDGTGSDHNIWHSKTVAAGLKKYSKNSRRSRGRYGRGLPKKGKCAANFLERQEGRVSRKP